MFDNKPVTYTLALFIFIILEYYLPNFGEYKNPFSRKYFFQDMFFQIFNLLFAGAIAYASVEAIFYMRREWGLLSGFSYFSKSTLVFQYISAFIIRDFAAYLMHRFSHSRFFWKFHIAHHESNYLDAGASFRVHPVNFILNAVRAPGLLLLGFDFSLLPVLGLFQYVHNLFVHSNIKIDFGIFNYIFISPYLHRIHHSNEKKFYTSNYGVYLSVWDIMFGTFINEKNLSIELGLKNYKREGFWGSIMRPFVGANFKTDQNPFDSENSIEIKKAS